MEDRILALVAVEGAADAKMEALGELDAFRTYAEIHRGYVDLAAAGSLEALKRAVFLLWYGSLEPPFLTGIAELDDQAVAELKALLEQVCAADELDDELRWMLPYYYQLASWFLPSGEDAPSLVAFCEAHPPRGRVKVDVAAFVGRGQMGDYWRSIGAW